MSESTNEVRELIDAFAASLDGRRLDEWLSLFTEDGYYACARRVEFEQGNNVVLIGEDMKRLRARCKSGLIQDKRRMVHMINGVRADGATATAVFALWYDGVATYAGHYQFDLAHSGLKLMIRRCTAILDNEVITAPIYLPI